MDEHSTSCSHTSSWTRRSGLGCLRTSIFR